MQEDRIFIRIATRNDYVDSIEIQPRQHLRASRVLEGKTQGEALTLLPVIYHVCSRAHGFAAQQAFASATGTMPPDVKLQQLLVLAETCREHARRIFMDWPLLIGQKADTATVLEIQRHLQQIEESVTRQTTKSQLQVLQTLLSQVHHLQQLLLTLSEDVAGEGNQGSVISTVIQALHAQTLADVGCSEAPGLNIHEVDAAFLEEQLQRDAEGAFIAAPHLHEQVYETGPLARLREHPLVNALSDQYGSGLLTRFCAMALELATLPQAMLVLLEQQNVALQQSRAQTSIPGTGMGGVEAARGFLWHRVEMANGRIKRYQILAPTEWNFHPKGTLFQSLRGLRFQAKSQIHKLASMITTALDPCVACAIEVV